MATLQQIMTTLKKVEGLITGNRSAQPLHLLAQGTGNTSYTTRADGRSFSHIFIALDGSATPPDAAAEPAEEGDSDKSQAKPSSRTPLKAVDAAPKPLSIGIKLYALSGNDQFLIYQGRASDGDVIRLELFPASTRIEIEAQPFQTYRISVY